MFAQGFQGPDQLFVGLGRHRYLEDPGKLPGHPRHAALQPVTVMLGNTFSDTLDLPGLIGGDHCQYEMIHAATLCF
ncbi:hypothetical protein D3C84_648270 [compost metagenome]